MPVKYSENILVIIRNSKFENVREFLAKHENTKKMQPQDLDEKHQDAEVERMKKFGKETLKAQVFVLNQSEKKFVNNSTPFEELEILFKEIIARNILVDCHNNNQYVLLHVYVTGHGYMQNLRSQILLNQRIHFNLTREIDRENYTTFMNPFPLENLLLEIYKKF